MVKRIVRALIGLVGAGGVTIGLAALADPARIAARFAVTPEGAVGFGTVRGDLGGFFLAAGAFSLAAALRNDRRLLLAPLTLFGCALLGRAVTAAHMGLDAAATPLLVIEALLVGLMLIGRAVMAGR